MHCVRDATRVSEYRLLLTFADGSVRVVDLEPYLDGEIFEPLKDIRYLKTVRVNQDLDTTAWDNGAEISPGFFDKIGVPVAESVSMAWLALGWEQEKKPWHSRLNKSNT